MRVEAALSSGRPHGVRADPTTAYVGVTGAKGRAPTTCLAPTTLSHVFVNADRLMQIEFGKGNGFTFLL